MKKVRNFVYCKSRGGRGHCREVETSHRVPTNHLGKGGGRPSMHLCLVLAACHPLPMSSGESIT